MDRFIKALRSITRTLSPRVVAVVLAFAIAVASALAYAAGETQHPGSFDFRAATRFFAPVYLGAATATNTAATLVLPATGNVITLNQQADGGVPLVSDIAAGTAGRCVVLIFGGATEIVSGTHLVIGVDGGMTTTADGTLKLCSDGSKWYEVQRSVN
jgi:hypothetical protein